MTHRVSGVGCSIGSDICHIPRIARLIFPKETKSKVPNNGTEQFSQDELRQRLFKFNRRLFTDWEEYHFWFRYQNAAAFRQPKRVTEFLAGRWAAKEAIIKAVAAFDRIHLTQIEIRPHPATSTLQAVIKPSNGDLDRKLSGPEIFRVIQDTSGEKTAMFEGTSPLPHEAKNLKGLEIGLSISHDGDYAFATALATQTGTS